ncbi:TPA: hypothetical protein N3C02_002501 [Vibrio parahaemolyticus]|uniref:hypothetical protein n=1 Tax=Vibrio parahaemolyticus TaxID=670 RepID=UPI000BD213E4|nr:hypothetical protein [Vibrio parahaemolyticus]OZT85554.1 hypothetical protein CIK04_06220 [Vibrio sp. 03_296]PJO13119.1 hypothetical protein COO31_010575 [Vibrio vulnificus]HAS6725319.1 hypothetical protein [Vibrio parahaemolyticus]HAS6783574.1 hypothetical protein [Vibrio parahaemolyticus]HAS6791006.1 hypothetical protein [Vibrio parahaemolyticus]
MTGKAEVHVFTKETLRKRDEIIAARVHQATVVSTTRKLVRMNPGQQLNVSREDCKKLMWSREKLNAVLNHIESL